MKDFLIRTALNDHIKRNYGSCKSSCFCMEIQELFRPNEVVSLVGKKLINNIPGSYSNGGKIKINAVDKYGAYYEFDDRQWVVYWSEFYMLDEVA